MLNHFLIILVVAFAISAIGFYKYVYFISLGYGFSIVGIGIALLSLFRNSLAVGFGVKLAIWVTCAFLYAFQTSPALFRMEHEVGQDIALIIGLIVMVTGLVLESIADIQKSAAKKRNPKRFVDTGLFRMVRCPNYFGEMLFWTGVFVSGIPALTGALEWIFALVGYLGIIYVMFSGARRLEIRQNKNYGNDPEYQAYVKRTPIMLPLIPLYSVEKQKWLVG